MKQICQTALGLVVASPSFITALRATESHLEVQRRKKVAGKMLFLSTNSISGADKIKTGRTFQ
jgi:hypothetical protein